MQRYGLIGHPLGHSFSEKYFSEKFRSENICDSSYHLFDLPDIHLIEDLFCQPDVHGLNVTLPYKVGILEFLDKLDPVAMATGAVNCIKISQKGGSAYKKGYNTDAPAFEKSLLALLRPFHKKALVLGTGGAAKAVVYVLEKLGIGFQLVSRKTDEGQYISYPSLTVDIVQEYPLIINATPVGMYPHIEIAPAIPYEALSDNNFLFDLVYNPKETTFLRLGKERGALIKNGQEMLELQAEMSWAIWNS